ncbi:MAG: hypothetical protein OK422_05590 [Thaumarchaeota archaeon]|nr:hypothetical protein [Nitrososphaerota archaeon]
MAIGTAAIAMVAVVVIVVGVIGLVSLTSQPNISTLSSSSTTSNSSSITSTSSATSTVCVVLVEGAGTFLHVISDSTKQPLSAIPVQVTPTASSCFGFSKPGPSTYITNASGWISIGGMQANYYFIATLVYAGRDYNFSLPQGPLDTTNATLGLPSGNLSISLCHIMATTNQCTPYTQPMTTSMQSMYGGSGMS